MTQLPDPYATRRLGAGVSAERHGERRRGATDAGRWKRGAAGERQTAALLEPLRLAGWIVLHDRSVAGATANIDHLVCDGHTLWILDTKVWRGDVKRLGDKKLWYADGPVARRLDALVHLGAAVRATCRRRPPLAGLDVRLVAVIAGARIDDSRRTDPVLLLPQGALLPMISRKSRSDPPDATIVADVERAFPQRGP